MNSIEIHHLQTSYGYSQNMWFIDGRALPEYLDVWAADFRDKSLDSIPENFFNLCPAWSMELDYAGDVRFVWKVVQMESAVVPLLLCEEDLDFSCIVIVVEVEKTKDSVYWNRIGYVTHKNEDFEEEKKSGILKLEAYTDEDWERYGDNIALEAVGSPEWCKWISENWEEELYRRRMNYTLPYYQTEGAVFWIKDMAWEFDRLEYENMVNLYRELEMQN